MDFAPDREPVRRRRLAPCGSPAPSDVEMPLSSNDCVVTGWRGEMQISSTRIRLGEALEVAW